MQLSSACCFSRLREWGARSLGCEPALCNSAGPAASVHCEDWGLVSYGWLKERAELFSSELSLKLFVSFCFSLCYRRHDRPHVESGELEIVLACGAGNR